MTLESLILCLNSSGWRLGSLCQLDDNDWYACLIDDEQFVHVATASTHLEAIEIAMAKPSVGRLYDDTRASIEAIAPFDRIDLASLGLLRKREPLKRRF